MPGRGVGGSRSSKRRADLNMCCLCARLGAACALQFPEHSPVSTEVLQLFYRLHMHHSNFFARIWSRLFFFPKSTRYFRWGVCVFSARSSFQTGKCPSRPGYGGGQPGWVSPPQLEVSGFTPRSCRKGSPSAGGVSPGGPRSPMLPWGRGCWVQQSAVPPTSRSRAGGRKPTLQQCWQSQPDPSK